MFDILLASGKQPAPRSIGGVAASLVSHGVLVCLIVLGSKPAIRAATDFEQRIAEYFFPTDRAPKLGDESMTAVHFDPSGQNSSTSAGGAGVDAGRDGVRRPDNPLQLRERTPAGGSAGTPDRIVQEQKLAESLGAFALLDVDSAAIRDPRSAAPAYPSDMEARGIEGNVRARFVIDSTGLIDLATIRVLESTNESFARSVRAAMPDMRFRPAMMGTKAVRQLAEQDFAFQLRKKRDPGSKNPPA